MTVNWTPEPARAKQPPHPHNTLAWTLWSLSAVTLISWVACMALGVWMGGYVHLLLLAFAVITIIHVALGFRNVEYFVPLRLTGRLFTRWRPRERPTVPADLVDPDLSKRPGAGFAPDLAGTPDRGRAEATGAVVPPPQGGMIPDADGEVLPGNDPQYGPGQRRPNKVVNAEADEPHTSSPPTSEAPEKLL